MNLIFLRERDTVRRMGQQPHILAALRESAGLSQAELGRLIGVTESRVCQVEKGKGSFTSARWLRLVRLPEMARAMTAHGVGLGDLIAACGRYAA